MQKRTEAEWLELVADYCNSALEQKTWCESKGINIYTFRDRLSKLRKSGTIEAGIQKTEGNKEDKAHEIRQPEEISWLSVTQGSELREGEIKIGIGGFEIRVARDFDESVFLKVCRALAKLC